MSNASSSSIFDPSYITVKEEDIATGNIAATTSIPATTSTTSTTSNTTNTASTASTCTP